MSYKIPFSGRSQKFNEEEIEAILGVVNDNDGLTQGKMRNHFEKKFTEMMGVKHSFAVCNATAGLELAAQLCLFEEGDEFIAPSHTFTSSVYPFIKKGGTPIWADIDPDTFVVSLKDIQKCYSNKTKAVIMPHLYGYLGEVEEIAKFCKEKEILLIEDAAQSIGTKVNGKFSGNFGDIGIFSFHSHKNITTLGEGGMITVNCDEMAEVIPLLRHNGHCAFEGERESYWKPAMGNVDLPVFKGKQLMPNNYCLGEIECAVGAKLLDRLEEINSQKRSRALRFIDALSEFKFLKFNRIENERHNYHLLVAKVENDLRDKMIERLSSEKLIQCVVQYYPLNRYDIYSKLGFSKAECPHTDEFFDNMISFPFHHWLSSEEFDYMLESVIEVCREINQ